MTQSPKDIDEALSGLPHDEKRAVVRTVLEDGDCRAEAPPPAEPLRSEGSGSTAAGERAVRLEIDVQHQPRVHPVPEDSLLAIYRDMLRNVTEAPDCWIVAPIITVCAKLLTPGVHIDFAGYKPISIFNFVTGPAGLRKSTTFAPAESLARRLLPADAFVSGNASDSALFDSFEAQPHRLQLEDEGNKILQTWASTNHGRELAARYLTLYDGGGWGQNFRREAKTAEDGKAERYIEKATISLCIGSTFGVSRFDGIDAGSGLRRRFGYYVATKCARIIDWPEDYHTSAWYTLADAFARLRGLEGTVGKDNFTPAAFKLWKLIQERNRQSIADLGITAADETMSAALNETPSRILKLAVIFQACRWAADVTSDPFEINEEVLVIAEAHQMACLEAARELEHVGRLAVTDDQSQIILAGIRADHPDATQDIVKSKTELTKRFAAHPGRPGSLTPSELYGTIIPYLVRQGIAKKLEGRAGYAFKPFDP